MNRLQKKAWKELIVSGVSLIWTAFLLFYMAHQNVQGIGWLVLCIVVGVPTVLILFLDDAKKLKQFDEREKDLLQKAFYVSMQTFVAFLLSFSFLFFFGVGTGGKVSVIVLPMMILVSLFLSKCTESAILLFQCTKENDE